MRPSCHHREEHYGALSYTSFAPKLRLRWMLRPHWTTHFFDHHVIRLPSIPTRRAQGQVIKWRQRCASIAPTFRISHCLSRNILILFVYLRNSLTRLTIYLKTTQSPARHGSFTRYLASIHDLYESSVHRAGCNSYLFLSKITKKKFVVRDPCCTSNALSTKVATMAAGVTPVRATNKFCSCMRRVYIVQTSFEPIPEGEKDPGY